MTSSSSSDSITVIVVVAVVVSWAWSQLAWCAEFEIQKCSHSPPWRCSSQAVVLFVALVVMVMCYRKARARRRENYEAEPALSFGDVEQVQAPRRRKSYEAASIHAWYIHPIVRDQSRSFVVCLCLFAVCRLWYHT